MSAWLLLCELAIAARPLLCESVIAEWPLLCELAVAAKLLLCELVILREPFPFHRAEQKATVQPSLF